MEKLFGFIWRRADFTHDAFSRHWRTTHREHALKLAPWLRGYVQSHLLPGPFPDVRRPADGCPTLWVENAAAMVELAASEQYRTGAALDEPRFMEGRSTSLAVTEDVLRAPPTDPAIKLMLFLRARSGERPGPAWPAPNACGRVRNLALAGRGSDMAVAFDVVDEYWWPDEPAYRSDLAAAPLLDSLEWVDPLGVRAALVDELVVIPPPR